MQLGNIVIAFEELIDLAQRILADPRVNVEVQDLSVNDFLQLCLDVRIQDQEPNLEGKNITYPEKDTLQ